MTIEKLFERIADALEDIASTLQEVAPNAGIAIKENTEEKVESKPKAKKEKVEKLQPKEEVEEEVAEKPAPKKKKSKKKELTKDDVKAAAIEYVNEGHTQKQAMDLMNKKFKVKGLPDLTTDQYEDAIALFKEAA